MNPVDKRLAVMVEDHPLAYGSFEGVIPEGEYGAGKVTVWDRGTYAAEHEGHHDVDDPEAASELLRKGLEKGEIKINLQGKLLKGSFALIRLKTGDKNWLIIKHRDEIADDERPSIVAATQSDDPTKEEDPATETIASDEIAKISGVKLAPFPGRISPMLAYPAARPFSSPDWFFEPKLDGFRTLAFVRKGKVTLVSRNGIDATDRFSSVAKNKVLMNAPDAVFDGEVVTLDEKGQPCFQCLQDQLKPLPGNKQPNYNIYYYIFDVIYLEGYDLSDVTLEERKNVLAKLVPATGAVRRSDYYENDGDLVYQTALKNGFEGVVAKRRDSLYQLGRRSTDWLKVKAVNTGDFVIAGYELGQGGRGGSIGSLVLSEYENNKLVYRGQVGTGFDTRTLDELKARLDKIKTDTPNFEKLPPPHGDVIWVKPALVAEVKYAEITKDGRLRVPVYLRIREDKNAKEAVAQKTIVVKNHPRLLTIDSPNSNVAKLEQAGDDVTLDIEGQKLKVTSLNKVYWPETADHRAVTKRDLLIYLARVSEVMIPHLLDRPITLNRFPSGIDGEHFYQRHWHTPIPEFVHTVEAPIEEAGESGHYILCQNFGSLLWLGQSGNLEFHPWFSRVTGDDDSGKKFDEKINVLDLPDFLIFDLDPYIYSGKELKGAEPELNREGFKRTVQAAKWLKETLESTSLPAYVKTSGKTGIHVYVPIIRKYNYDAIRGIAESVANHLIKQHPSELTMEWLVTNRTGKVFIDYKQNTYTRTLASVYSPRASATAAVSMGLDWKDLDSVFPTDFTVLNAADYIAKHGDPWADILDKKVNLDSVLKL
jgi:bifunctional non-homologous end joining protein LigD